MKNLFKAIHQVISAVSIIEKKGFNAHHNYAFAREEDVLTSVRPELVKAGLIILLKGFDIENITDIGKQTKKDFRVHYMIAHVDSGETFDFSVPAEGIDSQDKASPKALSMALKAAYLQQFNLSKGDDPDKTENSSTAEEMIKLRVPYAEKEEAKKLGARWDKEEETWKAFISQKDKFKRWLPYNALDDTDFIAWAETSGGVEAIQSWLESNGHPRLENMSKNRLMRFKDALEEGKIILSLDGDR